MTRGSEVNVIPQASSRTQRSGDPGSTRFQSVGIVTKSGPSLPNRTTQFAAKWIGSPIKSGMTRGSEVNVMPQASSRTQRSGDPGSTHFQSVGIVTASRAAVPYPDHAICRKVNWIPDQVGDDARARGHGFASYVIQARSSASCTSVRHPSLAVRIANAAVSSLMASAPQTQMSAESDALSCSSLVLACDKKA